MNQQLEASGKSGRSRVRRSLLTTREAADELGVQESTVRAWIYRRTIPYVKISRAVRISAETIDSIISSGAVPAIER